MEEMNEVEKFIISKDDFEQYFKCKSYILKEDLIRFYNIKNSEQNI